MRPFRRLGWLCAVGLLMAAASPGRAAWAHAVPVCDACRNQAACCPPPPPTTLYVQRTYYEPVTCYQPAACEPCRPRCGPIRRLLRRCFRVPAVICRPSCKYEPVSVCPPPPCAPPPCGPCACPQAPGPVILSGTAPGSPAAPVYAVPPSPTPVGPVPPAVNEQPLPTWRGAEPGTGERITPPPPPTPLPPLSGSSYKRLTPPLPPPPVPLDRVVSWTQR